MLYYEITDFEVFVNYPSSQSSALRKLQSIFQRRGILLAYLFGSQQEEGKKFLAGKKFKSDSFSDLDIGLLLEGRPKDMFKYYGSLYIDLSHVFTPFSIDIVFLNEVNPLLRYDIISGKRIHVRDETFADDYEERVIRIAADLAFKRRMFEGDFYEGIKNGHFEIELS